MLTNVLHKTLLATTLCVGLSLSAVSAQAAAFEDDVFEVPAPKAVEEIDRPILIIAERFPGGVKKGAIEAMKDTMAAHLADHGLIMHDLVDLKKLLPERLSKGKIASRDHLLALTRAANEGLNKANLEPFEATVIIVPEVRRDAQVLKTRISGEIYDVKTNRLRDAFATPAIDLMRPRGCDQDCANIMLAEKLEHLSADMGEEIAARLKGGEALFDQPDEWGDDYADTEEVQEEAAHGRSYTVELRHFRPKEVRAIETAMEEHFPDTIALDLMTRQGKQRSYELRSHASTMDLEKAFRKTLRQLRLPVDRAVELTIHADEIILKKHPRQTAKRPPNIPPRW